jgi:hypothetical protein
LRAIDSLARRFGYQRMQRIQAQPIPFHADTKFAGINSAQPTHDALLHESLGWAAIATKAIADRIAGLKPIVKRRMPDGDEEIVEDKHPLVRILRAGSPLHGPMLTRRLIAQYLVTVGEAYLLKVRGQQIDVPVELWVMHSARVTPILTLGQITGYRVAALQANQPALLLPLEDVIRVWWPDPENLYYAEGLLGPQAITQDTNKFADQTMREHFEHNAMPRSVIESTDAASNLDASQIDRVNELWSQRFNRREGKWSGLPAWLPNGFKLKELAALGGISEITPMLEHWRDQILSGYGVPRSILGDVVDANRAAAETNQFVFDTHTIKPIADVIAEALTLQLAVPDFGAEYCVEFEDFIPQDKEFNLKRDESELRTKVKSVNEILADRGEEPVDWGDLPVGLVGEAPYEGTGPIPRITFSNPLPPDQAAALGEITAGDVKPPGTPAVPAGSVPEPLTEPPRTRARIDSATAWVRFVNLERTWAPAFERGMRAVLAVQERQVKAAIRRVYEPKRATVSDVLAIVQSTLSPNAWRRLFDQKVEKVRTSAYLASGAEALALTGSAQSFSLTQATADQLRADADEFRTLVSNTTLKRVAAQVTEELASGVEAGESLSQRTARIIAAVGRGFETRKGEAYTIARTETLKATQQAQIAGFDQSGVVQQKQWNTSEDDAVRDSHQIDGQIVSLDESFQLPGSQYTMPELADAPGVGANGGRLSAANTINCRCFVTPVLE